MHRSVPVFSGAQGTPGYVGRVFAANGFIRLTPGASFLFAPRQSLRRRSGVRHTERGATRTRDRRSAVRRSADRRIWRTTWFYPTCRRACRAFSLTHTGRLINGRCWSKSATGVIRRHGVVGMPGELAAGRRRSACRIARRCRSIVRYYGDTCDYYAHAYGRTAWTTWSADGRTVNSRAGCPSILERQPFADGLLRGTVTDDVTAHG